MENPEVVVGTPSVLLGHVQAKVREKTCIDELKMINCMWMVVLLDVQ